MTPKKSVNQLVKTTAYLPEAMRDFHDQKDIFKAIYELVAVEKHEYAGSISWVAGQCYVIDIFLWWMAQRGYTLQKSRLPFNFRDLSQDVEAATKARNGSMAGTLQSMFAKPVSP